MLTLFWAVFSNLRFRVNYLFTIFFDSYDIDVDTVTFMAEEKDDSQKLLRQLNEAIKKIVPTKLVNKTKVFRLNN